MSYVLADGLCSPGGQPFCIKMKLLPGFSFNYNLGMLQLVRLTSKKNVDEKMQQNREEESVPSDRVRDGSLPRSILLSRTLVRADTAGACGWS